MLLQRTIHRLLVGLEHFLSLFQDLGAFLGLVGLQLVLVRLRANGDHSRNAHAGPSSDP